MNVPNAGESMKEKIKKELKIFCIMLVSAVISAAGLHIFIYPSDFAPCGVDGIATVLH